MKCDRRQFMFITLKNAETNKSGKNNFFSERKKEGSTPTLDWKKNEIVAWAKIATIKEKCANLALKIPQHFFRNFFFEEGIKTNVG